MNDFIFMGAISCRFPQNNVLTGFKISAYIFLYEKQA